jgi:cell division protein FtsB
MSKGAFKTFYYSKWFLLVIFIVIIFFSASAISDYYSQGDLRQDINMLESQINTLNDDQYDLVDTLVQVQSEDFVETEARTRLNLRKPGEQVIIVSSDEDINQFNEIIGSTGIKDLLVKQEPNPRKWWYFFFPVN